ncbi:cytochrome c oxidase assembly protein [Planctomonas psychrotolerans]|uniref:cytochrome c oxidase assembly protein n=1 Tax=Planctomonas psychrotolerans TaxID=2528712 RepID=UPI001D0CE746|nr:cytochrome c oxidase assembly protein [Planctomonas psychrotolerans]
MTESQTGSELVPLLVLAVAAVLAAAYLSAVARTRWRGEWPASRSACWVAGLIAAVLALFGPLGDAAHADFAAHMASHVLLGMLAPLLLVRAAPVTLALRALDPVPARRLARLLGCPPVRFVAHPGPATVLTIGGMWLLYATPLYSAMHDSAMHDSAMHDSAMHADPLVAALVNAHIFLAGYLFTASIVGVDPIAHRPSYVTRSAWLIVAFAGHGILAKYLYAAPPVGVPADRAEAGALVMYYGGDAVELAILVLLCARWYAATRPRERRSAGTALPAPVR